MFQPLMQKKLKFTGSEAYEPYRAYFKKGISLFHHGIGMHKYEVQRYRITHKFGLRIQEEVEDNKI